MSNKNNKLIQCTLILGFLGLLGYGTFKVYNLIKARKDNYQMGVDNYKQGKCEQANQFFARLSVEADFLNKIDKLTDHAEIYEQECYAWTSTNKKIESAIDNKQFAEVLFISLDFIKKHSNSSLKEIAQQKSQEIFEQVNTKQLANSQTCSQIDSFESYQLIPDRDRYLPLFYLGCIEVYQEKQDREQEFNFQTEFLVTYPQHEKALNVKQGIVQNPLVCDRSKELQKNEAVINWGNLMPIVYLSCGKAYQEVKNYKQAIAFYQSVAINYPEDELVSQADSYLASVELEINVISEELSNAADVIKGRIAACTAGSIFFDLIIDLGEVFSGKDCMTGESLHDIERWLTIVPMIDGFKGASKLARLWQIIDTVTTFAEVQQTQNLLGDRQSLIDFLDNEGEMGLLKSHNANLVPLLTNMGDAINLSQEHQEFAQLLN